MKPDDLKAWRQRLGLTQARAADALGITLRHYQYLEAGRSPVSQTIIKLCDAIESDPFLMEWIGQRS